MPPVARRAVRWRKRQRRHETSRKRGVGGWGSCLGCSPRRLYHRVPVRPISRHGFDAIRPAGMHRSQGGGAPPTSQDDAPPQPHRLDAPVTSPLASPVLTMETKKQPAPSRRKGGGGGQQQLRSPVVKRPAAAPVSLQGWLHKQGSEGLMLWKKRWFVLSEYCLFYYKGPEEEKLLGSILLPSYKISPCSNEDRVYRKFAFKAEHTNMRTYYFAADTRELMVQWMNALSLASILQEGSSWDDRRSGRPSVSSISSLMNQSADDSDSGFHGYRPPRSGISASAVPPTKLNSDELVKKEEVSRQLNTSHDSIVSNGWGGQKSAGYHQPLYANAPPKPRRLAEHEGASSPEPSPDRRVEDLSGKKTPQDLDGSKGVGYMPRIAQPQQPVRSGFIDVRYHYHQPPVQEPGPGSLAQVATTMERRTPDTYGRSNSTTPGSTAPNKVKGGDYEDVYNTSDTGRHSCSEVHKRSSDEVAYIKGAGPVISVHHKQNYPEHHSMMQNVAQQNYGVLRYSQQHQHAYQAPIPQHHHHQSVPQSRHRYPPRPHSADFLDYDAKRHHLTHQAPHVSSRDARSGGEEKIYQEHHSSRIARLPRPKSSLEVMAPHDPCMGDNYYWSEERYAQKMRQSASYVHQIPMTHPRNHSSSSRATTPSVRLSAPSGPSMMVTDGGMIHQQSGGGSSAGSVNSESANVVLRHLKRTELLPSDAVTVRSPSRQQYQHQQRRWSEYVDPRTGNQFTRSASARLPRQRYQDDEIDSQCEEQRQKSTSDIREGEKKIQQREESMKRLLEWKQRMLQSPLTRKPSGSSTRGTAQNELSKYYKQQVLRELASQEARTRDAASNQESRGSSRRRSQIEDTGTVPGRSAIRSRSQDGRRSSTSLSRYNSYSSDDEEPSDVRKARKRVRRPSQAGRLRHGSAEGKPSRRHHHCSVPLHSLPNYENVSLSARSHRQHAAPGEEIPPDAAYGPSIPVRTKHQSKSSERSVEKKSLELPAVQNESRYVPSKMSAYPDPYPRSSSSTLKSSGDSTGYPSLQDDRCSSGKHSDSGYDTLQAGRAVSGFADLLKFQINPRRSSELVYPVHELHWDPSRVRDPAKDKEEWTLKLKESQLMKDMPFQCSGHSSHKPDLHAAVESPPKNIVQSRIKAFEVVKEDDSTVGRESLQMQEPLKPSPPMYQPNEAHVSSLKNNEQQQISEKTPGKKSDLRNFVFGDGSVEQCSRSRRNMNESEKHPKSVRDLLADFERKSQLVKERQAAEEERSSEGGPGKRCVFSDTETLLYDTSSDAEDTKQRTEISESKVDVNDEGEEDKDEEVAAALGQRDKFISSCRDLGSNRDPECYGDRRPRKRKSSKTSLTTTDPAGSDLEVIVTPGYLRLSMAESLVNHEDSDSICSTPTNPQGCKTPEVNKSKKLDENIVSMEEHYMPMTPSRKAVLAPPDAFSSPSASHTVIMENIFGSGLEYEESSYVEMTEDGLVRSLLAPEPNSSFLSKLDLKKLNPGDMYATPESPRYCEIGKEVTSHYEFLCRASTQYEPVYMEVSPLMEALKVRDSLNVPVPKQGDEKKELNESSVLQDSSDKSKSGGEEDGIEPLPPTPPRTSLPDILNSSSTNQQPQQNKSDRDSSDADDEASKDLDSLDAPRHPRFSLSDTFRPASYYLGASSMSDRALMVLGGITSSTAEHHDSSDSDLVSPPPIPTSPPPLDDFDNSLELQDISLETKKLSPLPLKGGSESESNEKDESKTLWNKTQNQAFLPSPVYGSGEVNSSGSESVELRNEKGSKAIDRLLKRRPVSDDIIGGLDISSPYHDRRSIGSDLESIGSRSGLAMDLDDGTSIDLDQYLEDLEARDAFNVDLYSKDGNYDYYRTYQNEMHDNFEKVPQKAEPCRNPIKHSADPPDLGYCVPHRLHTDSVQQPEPGEGQQARLSYLPCDRKPRHEEVQYENLQMILPPPPEHAGPPVVDSSCPDMAEIDPDGQQAGAPYYYSDLLKGDDDGFASSTSERSVNSTRGIMNFPCFVSSVSRVQPLNNQRGDLSEAVKRNDIGRKVNAIHQPPALSSLQVPCEDESRRLAEELRSTTVHFLGAANKHGQVDKRNLYEADTIQRRKAATGISLRGESSCSRSQTPDFCGVTNTVNLYPHGLRDKSSPLPGHETQPQRRSRSLEGLLDDAEFSEPLRTSGLTVSLTNVAAQDQLPPPPPVPEEAYEGDDLWEEDALWRESLRRVSLRHTRSLDNLDGGRGDSRLSNSSTVTTTSTLEPSSSGRLLSPGGCVRNKISRDVTYVNESMARRQEDGRCRLQRQDDGYERLTRYSDRTRRGQTYLEGYIWDEDHETFRKHPSQDHFLEDGSLPPQPPPPQPPPSFEIDREKLRQWDLMSSAPLLQQQMLGARQPLVVGGTDAGVVVVGAEGEDMLPDTGGRHQTQHPLAVPTMPHADPMQEDNSSAASGSGSVIGRDPLPPRAVSTMSLQQPPPTITLTTDDKPQDHSAPNTLGRKTSPSGGSSLPPSGDPGDGSGKRSRGGGGPWGINVSAGELLGRTHEELVLLLIQLRRQSAGVCKAMETCHVEIEAQARLAELETPKRLEHLQKLDELKRHLLDLEKQYEKGKPLVNLVDNMVKLGSLYRGSGVALHHGSGDVRERLEFNQKVQEQRLLAEERRDWDRVSPDRGQLQAKVQELYRLDRLLQEESGTLQSLQQDKELLEKALGGLRHKLQGSRANPAETERYRKQQRLLEKELSRIRLLLAHNSKKLEETVAENARLEQELVVLRQKLQASRRGSQQRTAVPLVPDSVSTGTTAALEAELRRVQQLVGDLQRQRQELSIQVRHLTEKSHSLVQQIRPGPTGVAGAGPIPGRKRHHSTWLETDLDSLVTLDHGLDSPASPQLQTSPPGSKISPAAPSSDSLPRPPLYVNTDACARRLADEGSVVDGDDLIPPPLPAPPPDYPPPPPPPPSEEAMMNGGIGQQMDISEADDRMKRFYGIIPREKQQEIKTVRIVKRESERRQRDRDRSGNIGIPITNGTAGAKRVTILEDGDAQYPVEFVLTADSQKQQLGRVLEEGEAIIPEEDTIMLQFQRSMSLPRGFGKRERLGCQQQPVVPPLPPVRVPSPRSDSVTVLRNLMINRQRVRFESCSGGSSSSAESTGSQRPMSPNRPLTAREQLFGVGHYSPGSSDASPQLSPVFKSEAARAIVMEMASMRDEHQPRRRAVPKEKRRHHTVSSSRPVFDVETLGSARSRDDLDMERALRPRLNAPDVVRSTMSHKDFKYNENTIDSILGTPNKIVIPERYIPEQAPELSAEEQLHRLKKAEAIRKMLSESTSIATSESKEKEEEEQTSTLKKKVAAEKKQREHLLQLNQILAKQVMEKSKMVAGCTTAPSQE